LICNITTTKQLRKILKKGTHIIRCKNVNFTKKGYTSKTFYYELVPIDSQDDLAFEGLKIKSSFFFNIKSALEEFAPGFFKIKRVIVVCKECEATCHSPINGYCCVCAKKPGYYLQCPDCPSNDTCITSIYDLLALTKELDGEEIDYLEIKRSE